MNGRRLKKPLILSMIFINMDSLSVEGQNVVLPSFYRSPEWTKVLNETIIMSGFWTWVLVRTSATDDGSSNSGKHVPRTVSAKTFHWILSRLTF